jgi:hypothetical protein
MAAERTDTDEPVGATVGGQRPVRPGSFRDRVRRRPVLGRLWRAGVFLAGLVCIAAGGALVVLPGPLTIPPIVLGLWIWSTEFAWAHRFFHPFKQKGIEAWAHGKRYPVSSLAITVGGLVLAGVAVWAVRHYELIDRGRDLVGLT